MSPKFSVIITVYKPNEEYLQQALNSVYMQTNQDFEILLQIDDPNYKFSTKNDSRLKVEYNRRNFGIATSRNLALSRAKGTWTIPLDQDDILPKKALERYEQKEREDVTWMIAQGVNFGQNDWKSDFTEIGTGFKNGSYMIDQFIKDGFTFHTMLGCFRTSVVKKFLGWPALPRDEDTGFLLRAFNGGDGIVLEEVQYKYRRYPTQTSQETWFELHKSRIRDLLVHSVKDSA